MEQIIVDSDVWIDYLRGYVPAHEFIREHRYRIMLSVITVAELYSGYKGEAERKRIVALCSCFEKLDVTESIAKEAGLYRNRYLKSHGVGLADCILAVTAEHNDAVIATLNKKHYPMAAKVLVPYRKS